MLTLIITLVVAGVAMIFAEIFIPGMVVGILGAIALIGAVLLSYMHYGPGVGDMMLIGLLVFGAAFVCWWLAWLPKSAIGRRWTLRTAVEGPTEHPDFTTLTGIVGRALTDLRPGGMAEFDGRRVDVVAADDWIGAGEEVRVLRTEGVKVVVRRANEPAA